MVSLPQHHRIPLLLLILVLAWGGYLRFANLGLNTLASDEMNHFFVGRALVETGEPVLPSGTRYTRGAEYSRLVAAALPRFDQMEVAVRFPSAVIGTLALVLFAFIAWRVAGPWAAVFSTVLLALYPEVLRLSRFGRFYTLQLLFGLIAFYSGWKLVSEPLGPDQFQPRRLLGSWALALLTIAAFGYAATVQLTTFSVAAGFCLVIAIVGVRDLQRHGTFAWRWSVPWQLTFAGVLIAGLAIAFRFEMVQELLRDALTVPMWARLSSDGPGPISSYYRKLSSHFPLVISLSPLIFLVAIIQYRRLGWYLLAWFAVPLALHSIVFPWKSERYVILAIPALLLATGMAADLGARALRGYLQRNLAPLGIPLVSSPSGVTALVGLIVIAALITNPAFNVARRSISTIESDGWAESIAIMKRTPGLQSLPIGSAQPLVALHYWGRLDFTVQRALLESWARDTTGGYEKPYRMKEMGSPDVYAGRPTLTTAEVIRDRFRKQGGVVIGIDQKYLTFDNVEPSLRQALDREAVELCQDRCGSMRLYHWTFAGTTGDSVPAGSAALPSGS